MRYPSIRAAVVLVVALALSAPTWAQTVSGLLQKGIYTEETVGDLDAAIKIYEQVVAQAEANRSQVAQAHYRLAMCYEKKGRKAEAVTALQKLIDQFPRETEVVAQARAKLTASGQLAAGVVARLVWDNAGDYFFVGVPSRDGKYVTYVEWDTADLAIRDVAAGISRRLSNVGYPEMADSSVFSPDSKQVAYSWLNKDAVYELRLMGLDATVPRILFPNKDKDVRYAKTHDWSADGRFILSTFRKTGSRQIVLVSVSDGSVRVLKALNSGRIEDKMTLSPDGQYVAYSLRQREGSSKRDIYLLATDGSGDVPLVEHPADDFVIGWSPEGKRVVFASDRTGSAGIWTIAVVEGKPQGVAELAKAEMGQFIAMGLTSSGSLYYGLFSGGQNVFTATLDLEQGTVLSPPIEAMQRAEGSNWAPTWSPDGKSLACLSSRPGMANRFYIRSAEGNEVRELVPNIRGFNVHSLHWSPDGSALLGAGNNEDGDWAALRIDVRTGAVTTLPGKGFYPQWAADGKAIFVAPVSNEGRRLVRWNLETGVEQELYQTPARWSSKWWTLSPDGQQFAFSVDGSLMVLSAAGSEPREVTKGAQFISTIAWTPDGRTLLFGRMGDKGLTELWRVPVTGGEPRKTELAVKGGLGHLRVHPDGRQVTFTSHSSRPDKSEVWVLENFLPPPKAAP